MHIVTQFAFAAEPIVAWERGIRAMGNDAARSHVGLPGLTSPARLLQVRAVGAAWAVAEGAAQAGRRRAQARHLRRLPPRRHPLGLASAVAADPASLLRGIHFFPFGALAATAAWAVDIRDGRFEMDDRDRLRVTA